MATQRYNQFHRLFALVELLRRKRLGATTKGLREDLREFAGEDVCERTCHRDLTFLESVGLVRRRVIGKHKIVWHYDPASNGPLAWLGKLEEID